MHIIYNARIYTQNPAQPMVEALAIHAGQIVACGSRAEMEAYQIPGTTWQDAHDAFIIPGIIDAHLHLEHYANSLVMINCETDTRQECLDRVAERARRTPPGEWILGHGWTQHSWQEGFGNASLLDAVSPNNPIYLTAKSLHAGWCNSLALQQMRVTADTPDPAGGRFGRDELGSPDGILFESAMACIQGFLPPQTIERTAEAIQAAQVQLWKFGITGVHDFDGIRCFQALQQLQKEQQLKTAGDQEHTPGAAYPCFRSGTANWFGE